MNIFITGNPRCGKSTLIQKVLDHISDKNVSGIITPEIRVNEVRQGFKIIDLASKKEEILASVNIKRGPGVSRYRVNVEGIDNIMDKLLEGYDRFIKGSGRVIYRLPGALKRLSIRELLYRDATFPSYHPHSETPLLL